MNNEKIIEIKNGIARTQNGLARECEFNETGDAIPEFRIICETEKLYSEILAEFEK